MKIPTKYGWAIYHPGRQFYKGYIAQNQIHIYSSEKKAKAWAFRDEIVTRIKITPIVNKLSKI